MKRSKTPHSALEARKHVGKPPEALSKLPWSVREHARELERRKMSSLFQNPNQRLPVWFIEQLSVEGRQIAHSEGDKPMIVWARTSGGFEAKEIGPKGRLFRYDQDGVPVEV